MDNETKTNFDNLISRIHGTEKTLKHLKEEENGIKDYAIAALEDFIDTCDKLQSIILDSGLYGREFLGSSRFMLEKDASEVYHCRTSWSCADSPDFEFDLLYGDCYGKNVYYHVARPHGRDGDYIDERESARLKIEFIRGHIWNPEGYVTMKVRADRTRQRTDYIIRDVKRILGSILSKNKETIEKLSEGGGAVYKKVEI